MYQVFIINKPIINKSKKSNNLLEKHLQSPPKKYL